MPSQPADGGPGEGSPLEVLVVADVSGRASNAGGVPVASGHLTEALASLPDVNVTLLTVGGTEPHGDARILLIPRDPDISWASQQLQEFPLHSGPGDVPGMDPDWRPHAVFGHSRFSGPAAKAVWQHWYPEAQLGHVVHMPIQRYAEIQGRPLEVQETMVRLEREVMADTDLTIGVGAYLTEVARNMAASNPRQPAFHEMLPGSVVSGPPVEPARGETFDILFTGRVNDDIKGYDHLLEVVNELRARGVDARLRVRGVPEAYVEQQRQYAAGRVGAAGIVDIRPYTSDLDELAGDYAASNLAVMPSVAEGFGLVAAEAAARGLPVLVNQESGVAEFFADTRVPGARDAGRGFVVPDRGLDRRPGERVAAWAQAIDRMIRDYPAQVANAARMRTVLKEYSWRDAAAGVVEAFRHAAVNPRGHTVQGPKGVLLDGEGRPLPALPERGAARGMGVGAMDLPQGRGLPRSPARPGQGAGPASPRRDAPVSLKKDGNRRTR
ncbi:glycosyltransferase family 4 protein [Nocardiopsis sediminis]|uniref:Glycosyltransferase family 4 protein n=1 Tax=Nocardiopsis sediminis TaxID=1778267 RepID=A0ABV8FR74_9ACTN